MEFEKQRIDARDCYICGIYKIVPRYVREFGQVMFYAYYKPKGWKNWGMRVDKSRESYPTLEEAERACEGHGD